jgi:hypothetical protein
MSDRDFAMALAVLAEAFKEKALTPARIEMYYRGLNDIPISLLSAAVQHANRTRKWFPKVSEIREDCEAVRKALIAAHPYDPSGCESCAGTGWEPIVVAGVQRVTRCGCWRVYIAKLTQIGVTPQPLALPAGRDDIEGAA